MTLSQASASGENTKPAHAILRLRAPRTPRSERSSRLSCCSQFDVLRSIDRSIDRSIGKTFCIPVKKRFVIVWPVMPTVCLKSNLAALDREKAVGALAQLSAQPPKHLRSPLFARPTPQMLYSTCRYRLHITWSGDNLNAVHTAPRRCTDVRWRPKRLTLTPRPA